MVNCLIKNTIKFVMQLRLALFVLLPILVLSGCQSVRPPADFTSGAAVESLSSNALLSYVSPERSISGRGVLMFRKPGQIRAVILSPLGSVLQEVYVSNDQITIVDSGNGIAFSGTYTDLPNKGNFSGWRYIHWLIDIDPFDSSRSSSVIERTNKFGQSEKAVFENGLLISKTTAAGGDVKYGRYTALQGAAFPLEITYVTVAKETFTIKLEDPEINAPFADDSFTPYLGKFRVYPLSSLR